MCQCVWVKGWKVIFCRRCRHQQEGYPENTNCICAGSQGCVGSRLVLEVDGDRLGQTLFGNGPDQRYGGEESSRLQRRHTTTHRQRNDGGIEDPNIPKTKIHMLIIQEE